VTVVYDAGALVAADRSNRQFWADHRARLERGIVPFTTAPVVAQVSRSGQQVQLRRLLRGCEVVPFEAETAHEVGALAGKSHTSDVVDVHVVWLAASHRAGVITADKQDIERVSGALVQPIPVFGV
jgi:predicted nucleic acid-binding protein